MSDITEHLRDYLTERCVRLKLGRCAIVRCMKRGGYERGTPPDYDMATCEEYEALTALDALRRDKAELVTALGNLLTWVRGGPGVDEARAILARITAEGQ